MSKLFAAMGGREWARAVGAKMDAATSTDREVKLVLPDGTGPNRVTVAADKTGPGCKLHFGRVIDEDGEEMGTEAARNPSEAAKMIAELVAESVRRAKAKKEEQAEEPAGELAA